MANGFDLDTTIANNAQGPAKVSGDAGSVEQHSLVDQIRADRYLTSKIAVQNPARGLRFSKFIPPGTEIDIGVIIPGLDTTETIPMF